MLEAIGCWESEDAREGFITQMTAEQKTAFINAYLEYRFAWKSPCQIEENQSCSLISPPKNFRGFGSPQENKNVIEGLTALTRVLGTPNSISENCEGWKNCSIEDLFNRIAAMAKAEHLGWYNPYLKSVAPSINSVHQQTRAPAALSYSPNFGSPFAAPASAPPHSADDTLARVQRSSAAATAATANAVLERTSRIIRP